MKAVEDATAPLKTRISELVREIAPLRTQRDELRRERDAVIRQYDESHANVLRLQAEIGRLRKEQTTNGQGGNERSIAALRSMAGMPHVGELVKLVPRPETGGQWYGGVIKAIHGKGGSGGIEVLPKGHGRTVTVTKAQIKRYAVNERADQEALAREMGVPVG